MDSVDRKGVRQGAAAVNGIFLLNKPPGMTSNQALQKVKRLLRARKAGHTGSLDPAATGMLPLCFGEATKVCAYLLDAEKTYRVTARLGEATDTGDSDGKLVSEAPVPAMDKAGWASILKSFEGESEQVPPMYSALKQDGKRLYELARQGKTVERKPRPIRISAIQLLESSGRRLVFRVRCSKGTYVRSLVEDIARAAGTQAHTARLHRESVGGFRSEQMLDLAGAEALADPDSQNLLERLLPVDAALVDWPDWTLPPDGASAFCGGQKVPCAAAGSGLLRIYGDDRRFLGIGELTGDGWLAPKRIFKLAEDAGG
jgi:tRNA pseudouridine55 synthase